MVPNLQRKYHIKEDFMLTCHKLLQHSLTESDLLDFKLQNHYGFFQIFQVLKFSPPTPVLPFLMLFYPLEESVLNDRCYYQTKTSYYQEFKDYQAASEHTDLRLEKKRILLFSWWFFFIRVVTSCIRIVKMLLM